MTVNPLSVPEFSLSPEEAKIAARAIEGGLIKSWWDIYPVERRAAVLSDALTSLFGRDIVFPGSWYPDWEAYPTSYYRNVRPRSTPVNTRLLKQSPVW